MKPRSILLIAIIIIVAITANIYGCSAHGPRLGYGEEADGP